MKKTLSILFVSFFVVSSLYAQPGKVSANGIEIAYESLGSLNQETILLVSGTNAQLTMWPDEFCQKLVKTGFRVIRYDNRDIGLSTKFDQAGLPDWAAIGKALGEKKAPPIPYSLDDMAADAVGLLDALNIKQAHVVGASMGGMIAQRIAYNHPARTLSLASLMAGGGASTFALVAKPAALAKVPQPGAPQDTAAFINRELESMLALIGSRYPIPKDELLKTIRADVQRAYYPVGFFRQGAASLSGYYAGRTEQLKTIKVPTVVIQGTEDPIVPLDAAKDVAASIPGAQLELLDGMGHYLPQPLFDTIVNQVVNNIKKAKR